jgi:hypothetical protein
MWMVSEFLSIAVPPTDVSEECRLIAHFILPAHVGICQPLLRPSAPSY